MAIVIPNVTEVATLNVFLVTEDLFLRLYSNDVIPGEGDTAATYNQVTGGGYNSIVLDKDNWTITSGNPSFAIQAQTTFSFTGATNAPSTIYGYYVVNALGVLQWAERFPGANVPFTSISGSSIRITPRMECS
jgi:hypothetical protein